MSNKQRRSIRLHARRGWYFIRLKFRSIADALGSLFPKRISVPIWARKGTHGWRGFLKSGATVLDKLRLPVARELLLEKADRILRHEFYLLGKEFFVSKEVTVDSPGYHALSWRCDPISGYCWPAHAWYKKMRAYTPPGADIKYPWELSRCQHFLLIGEAYRVTGNEEYAREFRNQVLDWINSNPLRQGPNWACTMDVAIRIANWMVGLLYMHTAKCIDDDFLSRLLQSASEHGHHIVSNLEDLQPYTSNHYLSDIVGLYMLAMLCPILPNSKEWQIFAHRELECEIHKQVYADGWDYEASTAYHRLVTELFLYPSIFGKALGHAFSEQYDRKLMAMISAAEISTKPNGLLPQIGDNDSGRFLVFNFSEGQEKLTTDYLVATAARSNRLKAGTHSSGSAKFEQAGRFLFRTPDIFLLVSAGSKGQGGNGGHAHNDILSYELHARRSDIIVDPGTYVYTSDPVARNIYRSVRSHSTLSWPDLEPCSLQLGLFTLPEEGRIYIDRCEIGSEQESFAGKYEYRGRMHERRITLNRSAQVIMINDRCSHSGAEIALVLAPGIEPLVDGANLQAGPVSISFAGIGSIRVEDFVYSPSYGVKEFCHILRMSLLANECSHTIGLIS